MTHSNVIAFAQDRVVSGSENSHLSYIRHTFHSQTGRYQSLQSWAFVDVVTCTCPEEDVQKLLRIKEGGTIEVHRWMKEVLYDAFKGLG